MKFFLLFSSLLFCIHSLFSQVSGEYVVTFKDKKNNDFSLDKPTEFLSERAINRRQKQGISLDETDLPVSRTYLEDLMAVPTVQILSVSKWFNDVVISLEDTTLIAKLTLKNYISGMKKLPGSSAKSAHNVEKVLDTTSEDYDGMYNSGDYGPAWRQISMLNADYLHSRGYMGEGMRIAVVDAGFSWVWSSKQFEHLYKSAAVVDVFDFVDKDKEVYESSIHGNYVLSTMASYTPGKMIGTAPFAEYILLRSEDGLKEYLREEYYWTEAAEFADSAGADIINTSLGYSLFDDSLQNHSWSDLDGETSRISISSSIAYGKGMLLFNSAGNSGANSWQKISVPADVENVISVAAVDSSARIADFSSRGPTADGRIKPDLAAMGQGVYIGTTDGNAAKSNGTSFSSPVLAGAAACLWQANPDKTREDIRKALVESASMFEKPDTSYGYGIPDMLAADFLLKGGVKQNKTGNESVSYFPNPCTDYLYIILRTEDDEMVEIEIVNNMGQQVGKYSKTVFGGSTSYICLKNEVSRLQSGLYIVKLKSENLNTEFRIVRE